MFLRRNGRIPEGKSVVSQVSQYCFGQLLRDGEGLVLDCGNSGSHRVVDGAVVTFRAPDKDWQLPNLEVPLESQGVGPLGVGDLPPG